MRHKSFFLLAAGALLVSLPAAVSGQSSPSAPPPPSVSTNMEMPSIFGSYPKQITLADMNAPGQAWTRFQLSGSADNSDRGYAAIISAYSGGSPGLDYYYTKGQQIMAADTPYLVAYKTYSKPVDYAAMMQTGNYQPRTAAALTPATQLDLALLNLRTTKGLTDVEAVDTVGLISSSQQQYNELTAAFKKMYGGMSSSIGSQSGMPSGMQSGETNAKKLVAAIMQYAKNHDQTLPALTSVSAALDALTPILKSTKVFVNPDTDSLFSYNPHYSKAKLSQLSAPASDILVYSDECDVCGMRIIGYADGHVKTLDKDEWAKVQAAGKLP